MLLFKELFLFLQHNSPSNKTTSAQDLCCNPVIVKSLSLITKLKHGFDRQSKQYEKVKSIHDSPMVGIPAIDPSFEHRFRSFARYQTFSFRSA
jgi:hypothetical protein